MPMEIKDITVDLKYDKKAGAIVFTKVDTYEDVIAEHMIDMLLRQTNDAIKTKQDGIKELKERVKTLKGYQVDIKRKFAAQAKKQKSEAKKTKVKNKSKPEE